MGKCQKYLNQWRATDRKSYISLAKLHLDFLRQVTKQPSLISGDQLSNAVRRYEVFWLPMCKRYGTMSSEDWVPPLDIAWVWYLHMVTPVSYVDDCINLIGNAPSHALKSESDKEKALLYTKKLWEKTYSSTNEPFDVDLTVPCKSQSYIQRLPHDFQDLSRKQHNFYYQVSLPHYSDDCFLDAASERYITHLDIQMNNPSICLSLPMDVQLIMQTHQLNPIFYQWQIGVILGKVVPYQLDCLLDSPTDIQKRYKAETLTKSLWRKAGEEYNKPGTIYRGTPPLHVESLYTDSGAVEYEVSVTKIALTPMENLGNYALLFEVTKGNETSQIKIKFEQRYGSKQRPHLKDNSDVEYLQLNNFSRGQHKISGFTSKRYSLLDELSTDDSHEEEITIGDGTHALLNYKTNAACSTSVNVSLLEVDWLSPGKTNIGTCKLDVFKLLSEDEFCIEGERQKVCLPLSYPPGCPLVRLTLVLVPTSSEHNVFQVSGNVDDYPVSKLTHISQALSFPMLMLSLSTLTATESAAQLMTYPIMDYRGREAFSCRIVRSMSEVFYAIEIINQDKRVLATSHLLSKASLPLQSELTSSHKKTYFDTDNQQYAMLVRGQEDWGLCFGQRTEGPHNSFFEFKLFLLDQQANTFCQMQKFRGSIYMFTISTAYNEQAFIYLHLTEGKVVITGNLQKIPETIAFFMSSLVLRYIVFENDPDCWTIIDREGLDLLNIFQSADDVGLLWDGSYESSDSCTAAYRAVVSRAEC